MEVGEDTVTRPIHSLGESDILSAISHEEFWINCLRCPTCYRLSQEGSIEALRILRGAKVPHSWMDEFKLSFGDLESTWKDCPLCFVLHEIICAYVVQIGRREGAYIYAQSSLDFSDFKVVPGMYTVEDSGERKSDDYLVELSYTEPGHCLQSMVHCTHTDKVLSRCYMVIYRAGRPKTRHGVSCTGQLSALDCEMDQELSGRASKLSQCSAPPRSISCAPHRRWHE